MKQICKTNPKKSIEELSENTQFKTLWLLPHIIESTESNLTNGTLADRGGFEDQS